MKQKHKNVNPQMAVAAAELNQALRTRFKASIIPNKKKRPHEPKKIKNFKPADGRFFFRPWGQAVNGRRWSSLEEVMGP